MLPERGGLPRLLPVLPGLWSRLGLRARLSLLGTLGLILGLGAGGIALVGALNLAIQRSIADEAKQTGLQIAQLINDHALSDPAPVAGGQFVQIIDSRHRVLVASVNADRLVPLLRESEMARAAKGHGVIVGGDRAGLTDELRVVAVPAGSPDDPQTVIVARSLADVRHSVVLLGHALLTMYPLLVLLLAAVGWRVAGAALRPVEELRRGAERITGAATAERLPVPPSRDEIHRLAVTLNTMFDRLAVGRARQRAFVADAAHELRSPLASMRTQLEVAGRLEDHGGLTEDLLIDVERLSRLVDDLLLLARTDGALPVARAEPIDLVGLLTGACARYREARVPVTLAATGELWVIGDSGAIVRVMTNLIDNAVRHARRQVHVMVGTAGGYHVVSVVDDGPGIPVADRERVFDRFTRLDDARARDGGGTGLGLPIARELVRQHGGTTTLGDAGPGLRVEVRLPRSAGPGLED